MTDKEKIRAEIERMRHVRHMACGDSAFTGRQRADIVNEYEVLDKVLEFIDSLPEQPISVSLDEELKRYLSEYYNYNYPMQYIEGTGPSYMYHIVEVAKHFVNWQKEQMMKDAIEAEVGQGKNLIIPTLNYTLDSMKMNPGDKVKIIIVKED